MSYIDWGIAGSNPQNQVQQQTALQENLNRDQQLRALSALHGINVGDQGSVQGGINALAGLAMFDQASALTNLAQQRTINQTTAPLIQQTGALYKQGLDRLAAQQAQSSDQQQQQQLSPDDLQNAQQTMQAAGQALVRVKAAAPGDRAGVLDQELQQFQVAGLDPRALAAVRNHLNDSNFSDESIDQLTDHYASHAENFGGMAQGNPSGANLSRHPADMYGPGTDLAASYLNDPLLMDPRFRGFAESYLHLPIGPGIETAANLTAGQRGVAAAGPQAYASTTGTNVANFNTLPAVTRAVQKAAAEGQQAGSVGEIKMDDGSIRYGVFDRNPDGTPYMIPLQSGPQGAAAPLTGAPTPGSPGIARGAGIAGTAKASIDAATNFENFSNDYVTRKTNIENLRQAAGDISTGPQSTFWGKLGAFAAEYGIKTPFTPTADQAAAYEEVQKMAQTVMSQQKAALGLPDTNQSVNLAAGATPHEATSPLGLKRLTGVLEGNEDYINATRQAWETWKGQNHTGETYNTWLSGWMKLFDPRVFQAQYMDPAQRQQVMQAVGPRFKAEEAAARRLGYLGGG